MKKVLSLLLAVLLCAVQLPALAGETLTIVHVTDMHYLSPSLTDYGEGFMEIIENSDGKVTHYTPQLIRAFVADMLALMPDAVILTGDLTLNGAPQSHTELVELLLPLVDAGIQVLALSGNHDTGAAAYQFSGQEVTPVEGMPDVDFDDAYLRLGYDRAISRDEASQSYVAEVSPRVWALLVDVNANGTSGTVNEKTFVWLEEQLIKARDAGVTVITASHQPVLTHNSLFTFGYVINNNTRLQQLYEAYQVQLNLCGHLHMQHVAQSGSLTEIAASSLAVSPNQYGVLRVQDGQLVDYAMHPVDVSGWAARSGETNADLTGFAAYSASFFDQTTRRQLQALLAESQISPEDQEQMIAFAERLNAAYFAGNNSLTAEDPAWALWEAHMSGTFFTYYMRTILQEGNQRMDQVTF